MHTDLGYFQSRKSGISLSFSDCLYTTLSAVSSVLFPGTGTRRCPFLEPGVSGRRICAQTRAQNQLSGPAGPERGGMDQPGPGCAGGGRATGGPGGLIPRGSPWLQLAPWAGLCKRFAPEQQPPHLRRSRPCPRPAASAGEAGGGGGSAIEQVLSRRGGGQVPPRSAAPAAWPRRPWGGQQPPPRRQRPAELPGQRQRERPPPPPIRAANPPAGERRSPGPARRGTMWGGLHPQPGLRGYKAGKER